MALKMEVSRVSPNTEAVSYFGKDSHSVGTWQKHIHLKEQGGGLGSSHASVNNSNKQMNKIW